MASTDGCGIKCRGTKARVVQLVERALLLCGRTDVLAMRSIGPREPDGPTEPDGPEEPGEEVPQ